MSNELPFYMRYSDAHIESFTKRMGIIRDNCDLIDSQIGERLHKEAEQKKTYYEEVGVLSDKELLPQLYEILQNEGLSEEEIELELREAAEQYTSAIEEEASRDDYGKSFKGEIDSIPLEYSTLYHHQYFYLSQVLFVYSALEKEIEEYIKERDNDSKGRISLLINDFIDEKRRFPTLETKLEITGLCIDESMLEKLFILRLFRNHFAHDSVSLLKDRISLELGDLHSGRLKKLNRLIDNMQYFPGVRLVDDHIYISRVFLNVYIKNAEEFYRTFIAPYRTEKLIQRLNKHRD